MRRLAPALLAASLAAAGCGSKEEGATSVETKPSEVKVNIDPAEQDRIAADLKNFTPDKKK